VLKRVFGGLDEVGIIGQGTWQLSPARRAEAVAALRRGLDDGMTHIDTAEMYTGAEEIVGVAIAGRRDEVFLVSKVLPSHASRAGVIKACENRGTNLFSPYPRHRPQHTQQKMLQRPSSR